MFLGQKRLDVRVIFHGSRLGGPWSWLCRPGFRHCLMLVTIYFPEPGVFSQRYTMKIEPTLWGLDVDVIWRPPDEVAGEMLEQGATVVVKTTVDIPPKKLFALRGVISCVSVLKYALMINDWRVITPFDLYRFLILRRGAKHEGQIDESYIRRRSQRPGQGDEGSTGTPARAPGSTGSGRAERKPSTAPADHIYPKARTGDTVQR